MLTIYALTENNIIKYIGSTIRSPKVRFKEHIREWKRRIRTNKDLWIKELWETSGKVPEILILDSGLEEKDREFWEYYYIFLYRSWGFKLINDNPGKTLNYQSFASRKKLAISSKINKNHLKFQTKKSRKKAVRGIRKTLGVPIYLINLETKKKKKFKCIADAAKFLNTPSKKLGAVLNKHTRKNGSIIMSHKGYKVVRAISLP